MTNQEVIMYASGMFFGLYLFLFSYTDMLYYRYESPSAVKFLLSFIANAGGGLVFMVIFTKLLSVA